MANLFWLNVPEAANVAADGNEKIISIKDQTGLLISIRDATEKEINTSTKPRSIPDPWARAYLFNRYILHEKSYEELSDVQKEQHDRMLGAWRGFFAMLALSQVYDIKIKVKKVESCDGIGESLWRNRPETDDHDKIHPILSAGNSEYLIYANDRAVGYTDMGIVVLPGVCKGRFDETFPWSDGQEFIDPISRLTRGERMIVYAWTHHLAEFYNTEGHKPVVLKAMHALLRDLQLSQPDITLAKKAAGHLLPAHLLKETPLQPLEERIELNMLDTSETRIDGSGFCLIDAPENIRIGRERLVIGLLDERMYNRKSELFKLFTPRGQKLEPISASEMFLDQYYVFQTRSIDSDVLQIKSSTQYIHSSNKQAVPGELHLFPMKSEYIEKLKDVIAGGFEMSVAAGHLSAGVGFMVNDKKQLLIQDFAPEAKEELDWENMGTTAIWPNISGCTQYHVATRLNKYAGDNDSFILLPIDADIDLQHIKTKSHNTLRDFPKYLKALWFKKSTEQKKECGIVMMTAPSPIDAGQTTVNYALDFGTSASIAAYNTGNPANSEKVDFENQIILIASDEREADTMNKLLLGCYPVFSPFPTVYFKDTFPTTVLFQGGHPYFELPGSIIDSEEEENKGHLETNIKFELGGGRDSAIIQQDYIKGLIHMMLIHAKKRGAKQATLKVSYPISIRGIEEFKENIRTIVKSYSEALDGGGQAQYPYGVAMNLKGLQFITESEAATRYFYAESTPKECITLDIGGGSADLFTYSSKSKSSAMIASVVAGARYFLLELLERKPEMLVAAMAEIKKKFPNSRLETKWFYLENYKKMKQETFNTSVECLFQFDTMADDGQVRNLGEEISQIFRTNSGSLGDEQNLHVLKKMRTVWLFQLAAFFYYGGLMYKKNAENIGGLQNTTIDFFISGRGSQIISWLPIGITEKVMKEMVRDALEAESNVVINIIQEEGSKKTESAIGMLKEPISNDGVTLDEEKCMFDYVAGEEYTDIKGKNQTGMSLIRHKCSLGKAELKSQRMDEDFKEINPKLPVLSHFIDSLNQSIRNSSLDDLIYRITLCDTPKAAATKNRQSDKEFCVDKVSLADTMALFKTKIDNGTLSVDIPLFFELTNVIRERAASEWIGKK